MESGPTDLDQRCSQIERPAIFTRVTGKRPSEGQFPSEERRQVRIVASGQRQRAAPAIAEVPEAAHSQTAGNIKRTAGLQAHIEAAQLDPAAIQRKRPQSRGIAWVKILHHLTGCGNSTRAVDHNAAVRGIEGGSRARGGGLENGRLVGGKSIGGQLHAAARSHNAAIDAEIPPSGDKRTALRHRQSRALGHGVIALGIFDFQMAETTAGVEIGGQNELLGLAEGEQAGQPAVAAE